MGCQTCREPLKVQDKSCPVCRGKLTDARNLGLENILDQLPKIKCKNEGCTYERSDGQLVKRHEDKECRERPVKCEVCKKAISLSKLVGHLETKHDKQPLPYRNLGEERCFGSRFLSADKICSQHPLSKVNNDLEFMVNWKSYDANAVMFWISLCGTPKEAKEYEYTIKIESSADGKAGRIKFLLTGTGNCLASDVSHEDVQKNPKEVMLFSIDILERAAEGNDKELEWTL